MPITWTYVTPPSSEPVTLQEAKLHLREDGTEQDTLIESLITAARELFEGSTGRVLMPQTIREKFDCFPESGCPIKLAVSPARSVTSIGYVDSDGAAATMATADYRVDTDSEPARIEEAYGTTWPTTQEVINAVSVDYAAGYSSASAVPTSIKQCLLLLIGHWYEQREAVNVGNVVNELPLAVRTLMQRWTLYTNWS